MKEVGIGGEKILFLHHHPGRDGDLRRHAKKCAKAPVFGRAWEQLPKLVVRPAHYLLSIGIGGFNSLFAFVTKQEHEKKIVESKTHDLAGWSSRLVGVGVGVDTSGRTT